MASRRRIERGTKTGMRLDELPLWCGRDVGGVDELPEWRDWSNRPTTPDQLRIEDALDTLEVRGKTFLHVGIGNSGLARRFHESAALIDGVTLQENESRFATTLGLPNYRAKVINKFSAHLVAALNRRYDYIVDNNPTSFCCCRNHLSTMLLSYGLLLLPRGKILADAAGLAWASTPNDARWGLNVDEWFALARSFGLDGRRTSESVVELTSRRSWRD
jgi:hypothetical protein